MTIQELDRQQNQQTHRDRYLPNKVAVNLKHWRLHQFFSSGQEHRPMHLTAEILRSAHACFAPQIILDFALLDRIGTCIAFMAVPCRIVNPAKPETDHSEDQHVYQAKPMGLPAPGRCRARA